MAADCYDVTVVVLQEDTIEKHRQPGGIDGDGRVAVRRLSRKAALYLRTAARGKSMKKQRLEMEKFCARRDWVIASVYEDNGYSGITNDRPSLKNMLRDAAKGVFSIVVVWDVSRLTRSMSDLTDILYFLKVHDVDFCAAIQAMGCSRTYGGGLPSLLRESRRQRQAQSPSSPTDLLHRRRHENPRGAHAGTPRMRVISRPRSGQA